MERGRHAVTEAWTARPGESAGKVVLAVQIFRFLPTILSRFLPTPTEVSTLDPF